MSAAAKKVTIYTIAEKVGVSAAAVSIVLSNRHRERRISPKTVDKIRAAANELGYVPNLVGRRLRSQSHSRQIDLAIISSFEAPLALIAEWTRYLQETMDKQIGKNLRFSVAIELYHAGRLREMSSLLNSSRYNGVIITNTLPADDTYLENTHFPFPVVVIGRHLKNQYCVTEAPDSVGHNAAILLHNAGCKRPAIMYAPNLTKLTQNRFDAFVSKTIQLWGTPPILIPCPAANPDAGASTLRELLDKKQARPDALFAITDSLLLGAYRTLRETNLKIPSDISVIGIGDYETPNFFDPQLTTLADTRTAIQKTIPLLLQLIRQQPVPAREILLPSHPTHRGSVQNE